MKAPTVLAALISLVLAAAACGASNPPANDQTSVTVSPPTGSTPAAPAAPAAPATPPGK